MSTRAAIPGRPYAAGISVPPRAASNATKYASVVSTMWPTTSRTCQWPAPVGASQASSLSTMAKNCSASLRTTRRIVSLPS